MRLDHVIATVPDIQASHARLLAMGFEEAWPVGPFWPAALTSGIALGGINLELVQPDAGVAEARIDTLVLAPAGLEGGRAMATDERDKIESDPALLALRGFSADMAVRPQRICTNLYPADPAFPYFLCLYAPLLRERLAPARFGEPRGPVVGIELWAPEPETVRHLFAGRLGPIELDVDSGERAELGAIRFADDSVLTARDL